MKREEGAKQPIQCKWKFLLALNHESTYPKSENLTANRVPLDYGEVSISLSARPRAGLPTTLSTKGGEQLFARRKRPMAARLPDDFDALRRLARLRSCACTTKAKSGTSAATYLVWICCSAFIMACSKRPISSS